MDVYYLIFPAHIFTVIFSSHQTKQCLTNYLTFVFNLPQNHTGRFEKVALCPKDVIPSVIYLVFVINETFSLANGIQDRHHQWC